MWMVTLTAGMPKQAQGLKEHLPWPAHRKPAASGVQLARQNMNALQKKFQLAVFAGIRLIPHHG
jgi:hypothetical protein